MDTQPSTLMSHSEFSWEALEQAWNLTAKQICVKPMDLEAMKRQAESFRMASNRIERLKELRIMKPDEMPA